MDGKEAVISMGFMQVKRSLLAYKALFILGIENKYQR